MRIRVLLATLLIAVLALQRAPRIDAARHHSYTGTITTISASALTIHSKTHNANFQFIIDAQTKALTH